MALRAEVIRDGLLALADHPPKSPQEAARRYAEIYARYAADARTVLGNAPVSLAAAEATLRIALIPVFTGFGRPPQVVAQQLAAAYTAFWLLPPVATAGSFPGIVTLVAGTPVLGPALAAIWVANVASMPSARDAAQRLAAAIDIFTKTVIVTEATIPSPTVGPLL